MASRAPGQYLRTLTNQELLDYKGNLQLLTPPQRTKRRELMKKDRLKVAPKKQARARRQAKKATYEAGAKKPGKGDINVYGECCRERCYEPRLPGSDLCASHQPKLSFKALKAPELMRETIEVVIEEFLRPYFSALGLEFVGYDEETSTPVVRRLPGDAGKGIVLHGESKDGEIKMTNIPDLAAQVAVVEKLFDRVYGRPRTTTILEGGKRPISVQPVKSIERAQQVADLLARSHAIPSHEGRSRREPGVVEGHESAGTAEGGTQSDGASDE